MDWDIDVMTSDNPLSSINPAGCAPWSVTKDDAWNHNGSPDWHMQDVRMPVLIHHGEDDDKVRITYARAFHHGCLALGLSC